LPNIKSAEKRVGTNEKRRMRNRSANSELKSTVTKAEKLIRAGELEAAKEAVVAAGSSLDKATEKGILHGNNAARRKGRLVKKLNQALEDSLRERETKEAE